MKEFAVVVGIFGSAIAVIVAVSVFKSPSPERLAVECPQRERLIAMHDELVSLGHKPKKYEIAANAEHQEYVDRWCQ